MIKIALNPRDADLLSGLFHSGAVGAGAGALGMGAANLFGQHQRGEDRTKGLLKSMLLGGALGGVTGAGARAGADLYDPSLSRDPSSGIGSLVNYMTTPAQTPSPVSSDKIVTQDFPNVLAGHPALSGLTAGIGTAGVSRFANHHAVSEFEKGKKLLEELEKQVVDKNENMRTQAQEKLNSPTVKAWQNLVNKKSWLGKPGPFRAKPWHSSLFRGGAVGLGVSELGAILRGRQQMQNQFNTYNDPNSLRELSELSNQGQSQ